MPANARSQPNGVTSFGEVAISDSAEYLEAEPNNDVVSGTVIPVPSCEWCYC